MKNRIQGINFEDLISHYPIMILNTEIINTNWYFSKMIMTNGSENPIQNCSVYTVWTHRYSHPCKTYWKLF